MTLKKVSVISYDKKDCQLQVCPNCKSSNFSVFTIVHRESQQEHLHIRCIPCDLTYCPDGGVGARIVKE